MMRIILGYDASPAAERALERTAELAAALRAPVVAASISPLNELALHSVSTRSHDISGTERYDQLARDAARRLAERGVAARPVTELGHTADTLVDLAESVEADLIVVGASSHDRTSRLQGGVSDDVARKARCDVLLVR